MKTTIKEERSNSEAVSKEILNIRVQGVALVNHPERKLRDYLKRNKIGIIIGGVLLLYALAVGMVWGFDTIVIIGIIIAMADIVVYWKCLASLKKILRDHIESGHTRTITLDESGICVDKEGAVSISLSWDKVLFVRVFEHTICFFSKDPIVILPINKKHQKEIQDNLRENKIKIRAIGDLDLTTKKQ